MEFFHVSNQVALQNYKEDSIHITIKEYFPCSKGQYRLWINLNDEQFDSIKKVETIDYAELGMEAVFRIEIEDFPAFIVINDKGEDFFAKVAETRAAITK